ncbi:MAG: NAD(P)/FAD-dependent oxidoreductase [Rhodocyclaceae bacterium]|jgi:phytoene dehydrogenase-like protein|nr:NAD(P)/FAD-dependent oxidoreductase [Rhodocyclaceae bacterium]
MSSKFDVVVAGGGHNGLVAACYLAKAGMKVCVVEKNDRVGGGVETREATLPGFKHDICSVSHLILQLNPLIRNDELGLCSKYGLRYANPEKISLTWFDDGTTLEFYSDIERTCQSIAKFSEKDADAYRRFNAKVFETLDMMIMGMFNPPPGFGAQAMMLDQSPVGQDLLRIQSISAWDFVNEWFENPKVKIALTRWASNAMVNPFDNGTGFSFYTALPLMHKYGVGLPMGGAGSLTKALEQCLLDLGGTIRTNAPVKQIKLDGQKAVGVILDSGEEILGSKAVIANLNIKQVFPHMVPGATLPEGFNTRVSNIKSSNIQPLKIHLALNEAPKYTFGSAADGFFYVARSTADPEEFEKAFRELERGNPIRYFASYTSADEVDNTRAPAGKRVLSLYAFMPYKLKGGAQRWDEIGQATVDALIDDMRQLTTNMGPENILGMYYTTPLDIERNNNAMVNADILHIGTYAWQLSGNRPLPGWSQYKMPLGQLYLSSCSTHPGGGVNGASGRNVARILMEEHNMDFDKMVGA